MANVAQFARVVVNLSLDREFDYAIPPHLRSSVQVGSRVRVPFGRGGARDAYVVGLASSSDYAACKEILAVEGERPQVPDNLVRLARWLSEYYCCAREQGMRAMLPAVVRHGKVGRKMQAHIALLPTADLARELPELEKRAPKQAAVLRVLVLRHEGPLADILREAGASAAVARALAERGLVALNRQAVDRDPFAADLVLPTQALSLTAEQTAALAPIVAAISARQAKVFLLHGVTGSGKTEVYLQAIDRCLAEGGETIVLVPEISLTPQTCERFRARFGDTVCVLHSGLGDGERFDEWTKIHSGRAKIVVGARSALFAPFTNLRLIVVDEEHETTYKQSEAPRYHARDVAVVRGSFEQAVVVLGSATPAVESLHNCRLGKYQLLRLRQRVDAQLMPIVEVVDMRAEAASQGGAQIFSRQLQAQIRDRLDRHEQTILFLNRRGYASQMMCLKCGHVAMCGECSIAYTYHRQAGSLMCHLCGEVKQAPTACPACGDADIRYSGLGTEKVEAVANMLFPKARIARMDSDTMVAKDSYRKTLGAFKAARLDILIGTQMIAKGLHFPNVTLVGVIFADLGLHLPDFRAGERTFQLLTQVSGRAGRGDVPGRVVVQSYTPFHAALEFAKHHDVDGFVASELEERQALQFPPFTHMALVQFRAEVEALADEVANQFAAVLKPHLPRGTEVIGPMPAPIARIKGKFRYQLLLRTPQIVKLAGVLRHLTVGRKMPTGVEVVVDIDPLSMM